jgi:hypothetical protein
MRAMGSDLRSDEKENIFAEGDWTGSIALIGLIKLGCARRAIAGIFGPKT